MLITCMPSCAMSQFCSVANVCIDMGTCAGDGDCGQGEKCDLATNTCKPGGDCGTFEATISAVPPNLLVVLDRSCSMRDEVGGSTKWQIAVDALNTLTTSYNGKIRFGLTLFPDLTMPSCGQAMIPIPPADANEAAIQSLLTKSLMMDDPYYPDGPCVTNIDTAMEQASMEPSLKDMTRSNYALLITDGKQSSCNLAGGDTGTEMIIANMFAQNIPTFVIGFGSGIDPMQMNKFAVAGGVPNSMPKYYDASDQASLEAALDIIADATIGCKFVLTETPPDSDQIYVFFDKVSVPRDPTHMNGWDYDPATNTVEFFGPSCDALKAGTVTDVAVVFGCNKPPV